MYNPEVFKEEDPTLLRQWIRQSLFGLLVTVAGGEIEATHLPFIATEPDPEGHWRLIGHMAAANRQWRGFEAGGPALVVFSGPHAYISPILYPTRDGQPPTWQYSGTGSVDRHEEPALPTWNYVAVHVHGVPKVVADKREVLTEQVRELEPTWKLEDLPQAFVDGKVARVVAFELKVTRIEGKAKLGQRQAADQRARVAEALAHSPDSVTQEIAERMRNIR